MSATEVLRRRGTASECNAMTPANAEIVVDLTNKRPRLGDGITAGGIHIPNASDIQSNPFSFGTAGGSASAITISLSPSLLTYTAGVAIEFIAVNSSTGATTVNVSSLGAKDIYKINNGVLGHIGAGDIVAGGIYRIIYDGTRFQLLGGAAGVSSDGAFASQTANNSSGLTFNNVFEAGYDYRIDFDSIVPVSNNVDFLVRFSDNGGSSYHSATAYCRRVVSPAGVETITNLQTTGLNMLQDVANSPSYGGVSGWMNVKNPAVSSNHRLNGDWLISSLALNVSSASSKQSLGTFYLEYATPKHADSFQVYFGSGNISTGRVSVSRRKISP